MTNSEYQELIAFLGRQFTTIDRRFEAIDQRFEAMDRRFDAIDEKFREVLGHFDEVYRRLERLEQGILCDPPVPPANPGRSAR